MGKNLAKFTIIVYNKAEPKGRGKLKESDNAANDPDWDPSRWIGGSFPPTAQPADIRAVHRLPDGSRKERVIPLYEDEEQNDLITGTDEDGNEVTLQILDYFFYNGEEYAILTDAVEDDCDCAECEDEHDHEHGCSCGCECDGEHEEITCYIMKVVTSTDENGEEFDDFVPVEDEALEAKLIEVATTKLNEDDEPDDEE